MLLSGSKVTFKIFVRFETPIYFSNPYFYIRNDLLDSSVSHLKSHISYLNYSFSTCM